MGRRISGILLSAVMLLSLLCCACSEQDDKGSSIGNRKESEETAAKVTLPPDTSAERDALVERYLNAFFYCDSATLSDCVPTELRTFHINRSTAYQEEVIAPHLNTIREFSLRLYSSLKLPEAEAEKVVKRVRETTGCSIEPEEVRMHGFYCLLDDLSDNYYILRTAVFAVLLDGEWYVISWEFTGQYDWDYHGY